MGIPNNTKPEQKQTLSNLMQQLKHMPRATRRKLANLVERITSSLEKAGRQAG